VLKVIGHISAKYCSDHPLSDAFVLLWCEVAHPIKFRLLRHELECSCNVVVLQDTCIVVAECNGIPRILHVQIVHSRVLVVVTTGCYAVCEDLEFSHFTFLD
jgi:hypothetical protein